MLTIVDIVHPPVRIKSIVDDKGASKTVAVLCGEVGVIPERASLAKVREFVEEGMPCVSKSDTPLSHDL